MKISKEEEELMAFAREMYNLREFIITPINKEYNRVKYHIAGQDIMLYDECQHHINASCEGESINYVNPMIKQLPSIYFGA